MGSTFFRDRKGGERKEALGPVGRSLFLQGAFFCGKKKKEFDPSEGKGRGWVVSVLVGRRRQLVLWSPQRKERGKSLMLWHREKEKEVKTCYTFFGGEKRARPAHSVKWLKSRTAAAALHGGGGDDRYL